MEQDRIIQGEPSTAQADGPTSGAATTDGGIGLVVILISRTVLNAALRLNTFFLPAISRGLGVSLSAGGVLVSVSSTVGLIAPLFGSLSDRFGGRRIMVSATALFAVAALLMAGLPWYGTALVGFGLIGLAKMAFDAAMQVFIGARVPYEERGRALGLSELAWSFALVAMPLCGWLIDVVSWRAPFFLLGLTGLPAWWLTRQALPSDPASERASAAQPQAVRHMLSALAIQIREVWQDRQSMLATITLPLIGFAQINLLVVYGAWMEDRFGLTVSSLGLVTLVIGAAELTAELAVAFTSDRFGKRRSVFVSVILTGLAYLALPRLTGSLAAALVGSAVMTFFFEFTIVGLLPLVSGMNDQARGTVMALGRAAGSVSRAVAAPVGVALYAPGDISRNGPVSALTCLLLFFVLLRLRERRH